MVGQLTARIHSWKFDEQKFPPILNIRSNEMKAKTLVLPAGRHVVELEILAPLGSHLHLFSASTPYVLGTEEEIMPLITGESLGFKGRFSCCMNFKILMIYFGMMFWNDVL